MAVLPGLQGRQIGTGLDEFRVGGERVVLVLGHPRYYPRFGFSVAKAHGVSSLFPPNVHRALERSPKTAVY